MPNHDYSFTQQRIAVTIITHLEPSGFHTGNIANIMRMHNAHTDLNSLIEVANLTAEAKLLAVCGDHETSNEKYMGVLYEVSVLVSQRLNAMQPNLDIPAFLTLTLKC